MPGVGLAFPPMARKPSSYRAPKKSASGGNTLWISVVSIIVVLGVVLVVVSRGSSDSANSDVPPRMQSATQAGDHWHTAIGANVCGTWLANIPEFEKRATSGAQAGIHSHGDGLMHIHPFQPDEAGENATIGRFLDFAGINISEDELTWPDGTDKKAGEPCASGGDDAVIRWTLFNNDAEDKTPKIQSGDINDYRPKNDDVVSIFYGPKSDDIVKLTAGNPGLVNLPNPADVAPNTNASVSVPPASESTVASQPPQSADTTATTAPTASSAP